MSKKWCHCEEGAARRGNDSGSRWLVLLTDNGGQRNILQGSAVLAVVEEDSHAGAGVGADDSADVVHIHILHTEALPDGLCQELGIGGAVAVADEGGNALTPRARCLRIAPEGTPGTAFPTPIFFTLPYCCFPVGMPRNRPLYQKCEYVYCQKGMGPL